MDHGNRHKVYLIRHGETVDNVKGVYAGVRDSVLTVHGVQQIQSLGKWLAQHKPPLTHVYSSDLIRASKTADAICAAQPGHDLLTPQRLRVLQEQDFGALEGQPWTSKSQGHATAGAHTTRNGPNAAKAETKEAMATRANIFIRSSLLPVLYTQTGGEQVHVAIVSHGMMLSVLWKALLKMQAPRTVSVSQEFSERLQSCGLEHLGGWSNTGFLELEYCRNPLVEAAQSASDSMGKAPVTESALSLRVIAVDHRAHLFGLKRSRGGIGSSAHDEQQSSIRSFFSKKPRRE